MNKFLAELGIPAVGFIQISAVFLLTMLVFFSVKNKKYFWLNYFLLATFALQSIFIVLFHDGLRVKVFAALMLISVLAVATITTGEGNSALRG